MTKRAADNFDRHIGQRIRLRRLDLKLSQQNLGDALGVSFQQIQKYERGVNQVSTATLIKIANELDVRPEFFFEGAPGVNGRKRNSEPSQVDTFMSTKEGLVIASAFVRIADENVRHAVATSIDRISRSLVPDQPMQPAE